MKGLILKQDVPSFVNHPCIFERVKSRSDTVRRGPPLRDAEKRDDFLSTYLKNNSLEQKLNVYIIF